MAEHYFSAAPTSAAEERSITVRLAGREVTLVSARGVFSADRLDPGTSVLLRRAPQPPDEGVFLDMGCGYGPIACALALAAPGAQVWAVDVNARARELTKRNAEALGLANVHVAAPDAVPADVAFGAVYSNPPVRVGKPALHDLLQTWLCRLAGDGAAYLVVQRNLGADSLQRWLVGEGYGCVRLASAKGYRVFEVRPA
ncbi:MAG: class I SAM-dependent methyltransferase [Streptosporangiales bacterium]